MTGIRRVYACLAVSGVLAAGWAVRADEQTVGVADCSFASDPDAFLGREARIRRDVYERSGKLSRLRTSGGAGAVAPAASLPVRNFIDQEIFDALTKANVPAARLSTDEEFLRRVTLDLTGRIPSADDVRAFLADSSPDKRDAVIEKLLYSAEFTDKWTMWMGDLLQNAQVVGTAVTQRQVTGRNAFFTWIQDAVYSEKSIKDITFEAIAATGSNFDSPTGNANYLMGATVQGGPIEDTYDMMFSKSASIFLGISHYDCVLCHNGRGHLEQLSAWGTKGIRTEAQRLSAFFSRTRVTQFTFQNVPGQPLPFYANSFTLVDAPTGQYNLGSTFGNRPNRTIVGTVRNLTPEYRNGAAPKDGNWRGAFAEQVVADPMFARNFANRIWKQIFNLGLVEPVDGLDPARLDPANPPREINPNTGQPWTLQATHPELLEKLAREFVDGNYQLRSFLRLLVQSTAYQLSSRYEAEWNPTYVPLFARHYARRMEGEEIHDAIVKATEVMPSYNINGWSERQAWAMKLPEPVEPRGNEGNAQVFMNHFGRGNRDTQVRQQSGSVQQQLSLMNEPFVVNRLVVGTSPRLRAISQLSGNEAILDEVYLTFLSRYPTAYEKERALAYMTKKGATPLCATKWWRIWPGPVSTKWSFSSVTSEEDHERPIRI